MRHATKFQWHSALSLLLYQVPCWYEFYLRNILPPRKSRPSQCRARFSAYFGAAGTHYGQAFAAAHFKAACCCAMKILYFYYTPPKMPRRTIPPAVIYAYALLGQRLFCFDADYFRDARLYTFSRHGLPRFPPRQNFIFMPSSPCRRHTKWRLFIMPMILRLLVMRLSAIAAWVSFEFYCAIRLPPPRHDTPLKYPAGLPWKILFSFITYGSASHASATQFNLRWRQKGELLY